MLIHRDHVLWGHVCFLPQKNLVWMFLKPQQLRLQTLQNTKMYWITAKTHFQTMRKMITTSFCQSHINTYKILDSRLFSACWQSACTSIMLWFSTWALLILSISLSLCMKTFERKKLKSISILTELFFEVHGLTNLCDFCVSQCQKNQIFLKFGLKIF